jgi:demethylmenaquinone methyltransferase/2-methoxy-6-polyprenyl-1,4-benzoquinol methylase
VLYRRPRLALLAGLRLHPGSTVLDLGCGIGLNFPHLAAATGPTGKVIGIDASASMLTTARRRTGWPTVHLIHGDLAGLPDVLNHVSVDLTTIDAVVATCVLSLLPDPSPIWALIDQRRPPPVHVGVGDLGTPDNAPVALWLLYRTLTALGGANPHTQPWHDLLQREPSATHKIYLGGHIHTSTAALTPTDE